MPFFGQNPGSPGFVVPPDEATQVRRTRDLERALQTVYADGTLRQLVDNLPAQVSALVLAAIATSISTGALTVTGSGSVTGDMTLGGYLNSLAGSVFDITTPRNQTWWRLSDGRLAWASSSRTKKTNIRPSEIDPLAVLGMEDVYYNYIAEVRKRDDPTYADYVGPDYHVATEVGLIAEQLHELGLWEFVEYEREPDDRWPAVYSQPVCDDDGNVVEPPEMIRQPVSQLKLDEHGSPIPKSIHYSMLAVALLPVLRMHNKQIDTLTEQVRALTERIEAQGL